MKSKIIQKDILFNKFSNQLKKFKTLRKGDKIVVAVSGGLDSVALLILLNEIQQYNLIVAHVNHNLRTESIHEQAFVENLSHSLDIPFYYKILNPNSRNNKYSIEEWARYERYYYFDELLKQTNSKWIMTAHHGNDNVETILMNIARHSGILGMRGIAKERNSLLRPMLEFTKNEITEFSERAGFHFFEDLSNYDNIYLRNFLRNIVIKPWEKEVPHLISGFTKSIDYFKQWQVGLDFLIINYLMEDIKKFEDKFELPIDLIDSLPNIIRIRLFQLLINKKNIPWSKHHIKMLIQFIEKSKVGDFHKLHNGWRLLRDRNCIKVELRKKIIKNKSVELHLNIPVIYNKYKYCLSLSKNKLEYGLINNYESVDWYKLKNRKLEIRLWRTGDKFQPLGMKGKQKLSDFFINQKVNGIDKESQSVATADGEIFWVCGKRIAHWVRITDGTEVFAELSRSLI